MATSIVNQSVYSAVPSAVELAVKPHTSVYEIVTARILEQLAKGVVPWRKPWRAEAPCNLISGKPYRGLNVFLLPSQGYGSRYWLTYQQAAKLGGHVKRGEHSFLVTFWHIGEERSRACDDGTVERRVPSRCGITVSSIWSNPRESIFRGCRRDRASVPSSDARRSSRGCGMHPAWSSRTERGIGRRRTPWGCRRRGLFSSAEEYYSTLFHEPTHSTGHGSRVGREGIEQLNTFGSESYSREELIAEMGSAMLCGISGIETGTIENSAAHLGGGSLGRSRIPGCVGSTEGRGLHPRCGSGRRGCGMTARGG